jgi:sugar lactone lactonase YvrE
LCVIHTVEHISHSVARRRRRLIADLVSPIGAELGECPVWDPVTGTLLVCDLPAGVVRRFLPSGKLCESLSFGQPFGSIARRRDGGFVVALGQGFALSRNPPALDLVASVTNHDHRMNDGKCDPLGRFWAGSASRDGAATGALYRLDPDLSVQRVRTGVGMSNGLGWSPDGSAMYHIDSCAHVVAALRCDLRDGSVRTAMTFIEFKEGHGIPDGLAVDEDGGLWIALWGAGEVRRFTARGELDTIVSVPTSNVTSCGFGGADLSTLFITSAKTGLSAERLLNEPHAGALFAVVPGMRGVPVGEFAG